MLLFRRRYPDFEAFLVVGDSEGLRVIPMKELYEQLLRVIRCQQVACGLGAAAAFVAGLLFFLYYNEVIVLRWPHRAGVVGVSSPVSATARKNTKLVFFKHGAFRTEEQELLWGECVQENIRYLIGAMLAVWEDEQVTQKRITLQSAILNPSGQTLYLSFDRVPFDKEASTFDKWHTVEAILKTLRDNDVDVREVYFLVHHERLVDSHLDFSNPWPLRGFLKT